MEKPKRKPKTSDYDFSFIAPLSLEECVYLAENQLFYTRRLWKFNAPVRQYKHVQKATEEAYYFEWKVYLGIHTHIICYLKYRDYLSTFVYGTFEPKIIFPVLFIAHLYSFFAIVQGFLAQQIFLMLHGIIFTPFMYMVINSQKQKMKKQLISVIESTFKKNNK